MILTLNITHFNIKLSFNQFRMHARVVRKSGIFSLPKISVEMICGCLSSGHFIYKCEELSCKTAFKEHFFSKLSYWCHQYIVLIFYQNTLHPVQKGAQSFRFAAK